MAETPERAWRDPIVEEVRAARRALFAAAGNDIREFCRRLHAEQADSGHPVIIRPSVSGPQGFVVEDVGK